MIAMDTSMLNCSANQVEIGTFKAPLPEKAIVDESLNFTADLHDCINKNEIIYLVLFHWGFERYSGLQNLAMLVDVFVR